MEFVRPKGDAGGEGAKRNRDNTGTPRRRGSRSSDKGDQCTMGLGWGAAVLLILGWLAGEEGWVTLSYSVVCTKCAMGLGWGAAVLLILGWLAAEEGSELSAQLLCVWPYWDPLMG